LKPLFAFSENEQLHNIPFGLKKKDKKVCRKIVKIESDLRKEMRLVRV
jgi:hypothetical protein